MITDRDTKIMEWIGRNGTVTGYQVSEKFGVEIKKVHKRLGVMKNEKLVDHQKILFGQPGVYWLTADGVAISNSKLKPIKRLSMATLNHDVQLVSLSIAVEQKIGGQWQTAREIVAEQTDQSQNAVQRLNVIKMRYPDGILRLPDGGKIAVELELTQKSAMRVRKIVSEYARTLLNGQYAGVWYVCRNRQIGEHVLRAASNTAVYGKFRAFLQNDLSEIQINSTGEKKSGGFDFSQF